jgi:hypothetical protein
MFFTTHRHFFILNNDPYPINKRMQNCQRIQGLSVIKDNLNNFLRGKQLIQGLTLFKDNLNNLNNF